MGEPKNPNFYDLESFGRVPEPQNQYFVSFGTPGYLKENQEKAERVSDIIFANLIFSKSDCLQMFERAVAEQIRRYI